MHIPYQRIMAQSIYKSFIRKADPSKPPGSESGGLNLPDTPAGKDVNSPPDVSPLESTKPDEKKMSVSLNGLSYSAPHTFGWDKKEIDSHPLNNYDLDIYHGEPVIDKTPHGKPITNKMLSYDPKQPHDPYLFHDNYHRDDVDNYLQKQYRQKNNREYSNYNNINRVMRSIFNALQNSHDPKEQEELEQDWKYAEQQKQQINANLTSLREQKPPNMHTWTRTLQESLPDWGVGSETESIRAAREKELQNRYNKDKELHENKKFKTSPIFQQWRGDTEEDLFERALRLKNGFGVILKSQA